MSRAHRLQRHASSAGITVAFLLASAPVRADKGKKRTPACPAAVEAAQSGRSSEQAGRSSDAVESYRSCAADTTCTALAARCAARLRVLEDKMPSVVFLANDESGDAIADCQVKIDGQVVASKLDGLAIPIEPGLHDVSLAAANGASATQKVMVAEKQHDRVVTLTLHTPTAAPAAPADASPTPKAVAEKPALGDAAPPTGRSPAPSSTHWAMPRSPLPYTLAAVGVAAVAAGAVLTVWGSNDNDALQNQCSPRCNPASVQHIRTLYLAADISYGAGAAALAVATWLFAGSRSPEKAPGAAMVDVHVIPSGAFATVSGSF